MTSTSSPIMDEVDTQAPVEPSQGSTGLTRGMTVKKQAPIPPNDVASTPRAARETGDEVNRFLLCALVSQTAKHIKARVGEVGEYLPMTPIVRGVLRSYLRAAREKHGPLAGSEINLANLRDLNKEVLKNEIRRHAQERVLNSQARLAHANRLGDEARIKTEGDALERHIAARDQIARNLK